MRSIAALTVSLLLASSSVNAAPHDTPSRYTADPTAASQNRSLRPWRRLSDAIIRRVWGTAAKQKSLGAGMGRTQEQSNALGDQTLAQYGEDIVVRFNISTAKEAKALADASDILFLDVWEFNEDWVDIRIAQDVMPSLLGLLPDSLQNAHAPLMQNLDLARAIFNTYPSNNIDDLFSSHPKLSRPKLNGNPFFQDYRPLSVILPWMDLMSSMFTTHVSRINVGITYEGRDIPALRVGVHPTNDEQPTAPRKTVLVTGGSHAREWISTTTVNYLAWSLINSYGKDQTITKMLESFDFVFVPTLNPDGYVYSWETDRLWRKNRQPTTLRFCRGVDLDRSYAFQWDGWDGDASYANPCSESFAGEAPFDGVEAKRFADWAKNETESNNVEFIAFLDLHSYSQQILYPYAYTCNEQPPTIEDLEELAIGLAKAIRVSKKGHQYKVTSACEGNVAFSNDKKQILPRIESSGGSALDWFYHEMRIKYAFQVKLRDTGSYGFLLPKENIIPTGEEILDAVLYFARFFLGEVGLAKETPVFKEMDPDQEEDLIEL